MEEKVFKQKKFLPEMELLLSLAIGKADSVPELDWSRFQELTEKNRVEPLIAERMQTIPHNQPALEQLCASRNRYSLGCMQQMQTLAFVMGAFERNGIPAISLKGPVLAMELYGNPALRQSRDLDILVPEAHFEGACRLLEQWGYREEITVFNKTPLRRKKMPSYDEEIHRAYCKGSSCIEIHWKLSKRLDIPFQELWSRRRVKMLLGQGISCLGKEDERIYLIVHAAGHGYRRIRWLLDIYELQKKEQGFWTEAYRNAREYHAGAMVVETLLILHQCRVFRMPDMDLGFLKIVHGDNEVRLTYDPNICSDMKLGSLLAADILPVLLDQRDSMGAAGRRYYRRLPAPDKENCLIYYLKAAFAPSRADLEKIDLPDKLYFLYYLIHPLHKIYRCIFERSTARKGW